MGRRTFREVLDGPANAITVNKDGTRMAVVGRNGKFLTLSFPLSVVKERKKEKKQIKREKKYIKSERIVREKERKKSVD